MNLQETLSLIEALKSAGVTKFKSLEHDISFGGEVVPHRTIEKPNVDKPVEVVENKEATEQLKGLINSLKMSDEDLLNKIMPDGAML